VRNDRKPRLDERPADETFFNELQAKRDGAPYASDTMPPANQPPRAPASAHASSPTPATIQRGSPWAKIQSVPDFLSAPEPEGDFLVPRLLARGSLTLIFSPRGLGKTHAAHSVAVELARQGKRVLLIDRDNSRRELKRRLRGWGGDCQPSLKVLDRDHAPPLTDRRTWQDFPFADYDLVIIDSFDSSAEGVGEQDSSRTSLALAPLLDLVHRASGPAVLVLGNTIKSGSHSRGSGVIEDRGDIVYEVRDATGFLPSGTKDWSRELPPADRGSWADRAARRKRRDSYRLAFTPTKCRIGPEPDPFVLEIRLNPEPWTCEDVTATIAAAGEDAREQVARQKSDLLDRAAAGLAAEVARRATSGSPIHKRDEAVALLVEHGLSRDGARALIAQRAGRQWRLSGGARRSDPLVLLPPEGVASGGVPAGMQAHAEARQMRLGEASILAAQEPCAPPQSGRAEPAIDTASSDWRFRRTEPPRRGVQNHPAAPETLTEPLADCAGPPTPDRSGNRVLNNPADDGEVRGSVNDAVAPLDEWEGVPGAALTPEEVRALGHHRHHQHPHPQADGRSPALEPEAAAVAHPAAALAASSASETRPEPERPGDGHA